MGRPDPASWNPFTGECDRELPETQPRLARGQRVGLGGMLGTVKRVGRGDPVPWVDVAWDAGWSKRQPKPSVLTVIVHDPRCQHEHDDLNPGRKCDSRCNEGAAAPWHRPIPGGPGNHTAHAWCLPIHYTAAGWKPGEGTTAVPMSAHTCFLCAGEMTRFPR